MCGRDLIAVAKTGSGKTLAFLLPMFRHILVQPPLQEGEGPIGLIMAPARELAFQVKPPPPHPHLTPTTSPSHSFLTLSHNMSYNTSIKFSPPVLILLVLDFQ